MKDVELRGLILEKLYEKRSESMNKPVPSDFNPTIGFDEISRICVQLKEHGLVHATLSTPDSGSPFLLRARITARGVDVIESGASPDLRIDLAKHKRINNSGSSKVVLDKRDGQLVRHSINELVKVVDSVNGTPEEKIEARKILKSFLLHPLIFPLDGVGTDILE